MDWQLTFYIYVSLVLAYCIGSIPFGLILAKNAGHGDIRTIGSGNIGATNVLRTGNKSLAATVLFLDMAKGYLSFYLGSYIDDDIGMLCAFICVLGHIYPAWLDFKGGKGVATSLGTLLAIQPLVGIMVAGLWGFTSALTKISSASAITAFTLSPFIAYFFHLYHLSVYCAGIALIILWTHRANIKRLLNGTESKINLKKQ